MRNKILISVGVFLLLVILVFTTKETTYEYSVNTQIKLIESKINLKTIKVDSIYRGTLPIKNNTVNPLLVMSIEKSTDNIIIDQEAQIFKYNKPVEIDFIYRAKELGVFDEYIVIKGNFPEKEIKFPIIGKVVE